MSRAQLRSLTLLASLAVTPSWANAQAPQASASALPAPSIPRTSAGATCVERIPTGKARPKMKETIAPNAISGHAQELQIEIEHGIGETVLPTGFRLEAGSDEAKAFEASGFVFPDPEGPSAPKSVRKESGATAVTTVKLYFVPLPKEPGRNALTLPAVPISLARASGEIMTLCTSPHAISVEDPIANDPDPKPKPNPPPRRQLEDWTLARQLAIAALIALVVGALLAWLVMRWMKRPKKLPPPPPPRPPWDVAMEGLFDVRHAGLLESHRQTEFYDRVSDVIRRYLGERYGYEGLESTTREALAALRRVSVPMDVYVQIQQFMQDADLVKFARRAPSDAECADAITAAESIVARTRPNETTPAMDTGTLPPQGAAQ